MGRNGKLNPGAISSTCYLRWLLDPDQRAKNVPGIREAESNSSKTTRQMPCIQVICGAEIWLWKPRRLAWWPGSDSLVWLASSMSAGHQILALRSNKARDYFHISQAHRQRNIPLPQSFLGFCFSCEECAWSKAASSGNAPLILLPKPSPSWLQELKLHPK